VLLCDSVGRVVNYPYEIPIGVVIGVVGSLLFLVLLLRGQALVA
jgi:iron complex transport system permease protein